MRGMAHLKEGSMPIRGAIQWLNPLYRQLSKMTHRSTVKTLPANLPERWAVGRGQRLEVQASLLPPRGRRTRVTGAGC